MGFQVSFLSQELPKGIINFFTAGADQYAICDPGATLTAIVNGELFGHDILWEQMTGTPVTFSGPLDKLSVSFTVPENTYDDKVFRFWIDKGTIFEQYDDITVFGTPTSIGYLPRDATNNDSWAGFGPATIVPSLTTYRHFSTVEPYLAGVDHDPHQVALRWTVETSNEELKVIQYVIETRPSSASQWTTYAIAVQGNENFLNDVPLNAEYRVSVVYQLFHRYLPTQYYTSTSDVIYVHADPSTAFNMDGAASDYIELLSTTTSSGNSVAYNYSTFLVTLGSQVVESTFEVTATTTSTDNSSAYNYSTFMVTLTSFGVDGTTILPDTIELDATTSSSANTYVHGYNVLDVQGVDIGNISIG